MRALALAVTCSAFLVAQPLLAWPAGAQHPPVVLRGTEVRALHSEVLGRDLELHIKLPWTYGEGEAEYPVFFTLDANRSFPVYATTSSIFETPGSAGAREVVVVGVAYPECEDRLEGLIEWVVSRQRDFTPERNPESERRWEERLRPFAGGEKVEVRTGGAAAFLQFLRHEAIPFVEANYRVSTTDRSLGGYSLGGLFTLYALFQEPATFTRYLAGDPTMARVLFEEEGRYTATHQELEAELYVVTAGARQSVAQFLERLGSRSYPGLHVRHEVLEGEGHTSAGPAAISRMLGVVHGLPEEGK